MGVKCLGMSVVKRLSSVGALYLSVICLGVYSA